MPEITAKVVNRFKESAHKGHIYEAGDVYPADGFVADEARIYYLTGVHPKYKKIYLADVTIHGDNNEGEEKIVVTVEGFPKHTGGGWYELSNNEKVQGKDEAIAAEAELQKGK